MTSSVCSFSGHRQIYRIHSEALPKKLSELIDVLCDCGITRFQSGGAMGFDLLAAELVIEKRERGRDIFLCMLLPCRDQAARWPSATRRRYERVLEKADEVMYISDKYNQFCMHERNRRLVDTADTLLCYLMRDASGTAYTKNYAEEVGKKIINIADML